MQIKSELKLNAGRMLLSFSSLYETKSRVKGESVKFTQKI